MILFRFAMKTIKKFQMWQLMLWEELGVLHTVFKLNERFLKMCLKLFFPDVYRQKEILFIVSSIALWPFLQCILMNMINIYGKTPEIYEAKSVNDDLFGPF